MERRASQVVRRNSENWLASQNSAITQPFDMKNMKFNRRPVNIQRWMFIAAESEIPTCLFNSYFSLNNDISAIEDLLLIGSIQILLSFQNQLKWNKFNVRIKQVVKNFFSEKVLKILIQVNILLTLLFRVFIIFVILNKNCWIFDLRKVNSLKVSFLTKWC